MIAELLRGLPEPARSGADAARHGSGNGPGVAVECQSGVLVHHGLACHPRIGSPTQVTVSSIEPYQSRSNAETCAKNKSAADDCAFISNLKRPACLLKWVMTPHFSHQSVVTPWCVRVCSPVFNALVSPASPKILAQNPGPAFVPVTRLLVHCTAAAKCNASCRSRGCIQLVTATRATQAQSSAARAAMSCAHAAQETEPRPSKTHHPGLAGCICWCSETLDRGSKTNKIHNSNTRLPSRDFGIIPGSM
jgi:hypothetical protein